MEWTGYFAYLSTGWTSLVMMERIFPWILYQKYYLCKKVLYLQVHRASMTPPYWLVCNFKLSMCLCSNKCNYSYFTHFSGRLHPLPLSCSQWPAKAMNFWCTYTFPMFDLAQPSLRCILCPDFPIIVSTTLQICPAELSSWVSWAVQSMLGWYVVLPSQACLGLSFCVSACAGTFIAHADLGDCAVTDNVCVCNSQVFVRGFAGCIEQTLAQIVGLYYKNKIVGFNPG